MDRRYQIGLTSDFQTSAAGRLDSALRELFDPTGRIDCRYIEARGFDTLGGFVAAEDLAGLDAVIALGHRFTAASFSADTRLAAIARWGVGYDRIDVGACTENNILLSINVDAVRRPVAEAILTMMLALAKQLPNKDRLLRAGRWDRSAFPGVGLRGKVVGTIGYGNIATELLHLVTPFGVGRLLAHDPYASRELATTRGVELVTLETLFKEADFVTINCPLTEETRGLVDTCRLAQMKPTAYLINTARGAIVNQADLTRALQNKDIAGAGLDVFEQEPIDPDDPLLALDNVILTPHSLAWTDELFHDNSVDACRSVLDVLEGRVPPHVVNREVLARAGLQTKLVELARRSG